MSRCHACNEERCRCMAANGPRQPYNDECDHDFDEDEDAGEFVCIVPGCGYREPIPLDKLMK